MKLKVRLSPIMVDKQLRAVKKVEFYLPMEEIQDLIAKLGEDAALEKISEELKQQFKRSFKKQ